MAEEKKVPEFNTEEIPPVDFKNFIIGISQSVLIYLGLIPDPITNKINKNLPLAKHTIDTIEMLKEKTKGNLTSEEASVINSILTDLKLKYVQILQAEGSNDSKT